MKLDSWEREPLWLKILTPYLKKKCFPKLNGKPEIGKWYRIYADGCVAANGDETYANFQLGTENKLLVFFVGGGISWNAYTAARPVSLYEKDMNSGFYTIRIDLLTDINRNKGIFEDNERNPFRNWSKLAFIYDTGDFHCGTGDFPYIAKDGSERICHHHGYTNYRKVMETVTKLIPSPEALVVSGCSGGAFGAALLTDDMMDVYPDCRNVTCLVDSGFFPLEGWHDIARDVWAAPKKITERIHSNNITLDVLQALRRERGDSVKILICTSERDSNLARMTNYTLHGSFSFSKESGDELQVWLKDMMDQVKETIPNTGLYVFHVPDEQQKKKNLTKHCILEDTIYHLYRVEGVTCAEWVNNAVNGEIRSYGMDLLG